MSGSRAAIDINLDEFERRLRSAGASQDYVEDPLSELARLVDEARPLSGGQAPRSEPREAVNRSASVELRRSLTEPEADPQVALGEGENEPGAEVGDDCVAHEAPLTGSEAPTRSRKWLVSVSALALAGVAMIGGVVALKGGVPGLPKQPPFIAALSGPTKVKPPSDQAATAQTDAGVSLLKDSAKPAPVKIVNSEEQPVDLTAETSVGAVAKPAADAAPIRGDGAVRATIDTPVVVASAGASPPMTSQFPDPKPVRTVSLRPDGTPIPASAALTPDPQSAPPPAEPKAATKGTPPKASDAASPQPSTPKIELPTKLSSKSSARVIVAKTDTTAPEGAAPLTLGSTAKPEKTKPPKAHEAAAEKPVAAAAEQPVDPDAATKSGGWAVQLAAPRTEAEAESAAKGLNAKYASALNGSTIGVYKAVVKGATIYRLRVAGLSKADAAALCARLKGEGGECFIAK